MLLVIPLVLRAMTRRKNNRLILRNLAVTFVIYYFKANRLSVALLYKYTNIQQLSCQTYILFLNNLPCQSMTELNILYVFTPAYSAFASETLTLWSYHFPFVPISARSNSFSNASTGTSKA